MPEIREKIARLIHADAPSLALTDNVTSAMSYIAEGLTLKPGDEVAKASATANLSWANPSAIHSK